MVLAGVDKSADYWISEAVEGRWGGLGGIDVDTGEKSYDILLVTKAVDMAKMYLDEGYRINMIGLESYAFDFLAPLFYDEMDRAGISVPVVELKPRSRRKKDRIRSLIPKSSRGKIHIKPEHVALKNQMLMFDHDQDKQRGLNILDAFAYIEDVAFEPEADKGDGCGSDANKDAWRDFIEDNGRVIGGRNASDRMVASLGDSW